jgi:CRISPR-associated protein Csb1
MTAEIEIVTASILNQWATDPAGPVALHLKQKLLPVEGEGGIIFPPTYADIGYNIDTLADGTCVATIDSVGSQANRLEPIFKASTGSSRDQWLVPQIEILLRTEDCGECGRCRAAQGENGQKGKKKTQCENPHKVTRSILDLAHRGADAVVQSCPGLAALLADAFQKLRRTGDASLLCEIAPTSLVFGVWDSRGGSGEKRPRLVRSIIRAWDVEPLHAAAQFNSVWKTLDDDQKATLKETAKVKKVKLSEKGFADAPGVFRKTERIPQYSGGAPNPEARVLGGVLARGRIEREVTLNLVALRGLRAGKGETDLRKYLLGLSLVVATADIDLFLREGCHLRYAGEDTWLKIPRRGDPAAFTLEASAKDYANSTAYSYREEWRKRWPNDTDLEYRFDLKRATELLAKKTDDEADASAQS